MSDSTRGAISTRFLKRTLSTLPLLVGAISEEDNAEEGSLPPAEAVAEFPEILSITEAALALQHRQIKRERNLRRGRVGMGEVTTESWGESK